MKAQQARAPTFDDAENDDNENDDAAREHTSQGSRDSQNRALAACDNELYYVPKLKTYQTYWEEFDVYLKNY
ncbi:hypothetical protein PI125_g3626 [Phytophthora idaei]|nr:hypothetical protein PI125_g3626 [Phytophthora idaei]KAG3140124.1 hypothetical protein PI126_g16157 [Phytophthora idaei]